MNCSPSSRQLKKYKFFLPAEIYLLAVFMQLASKFHVFPLMLKFQDSFANVCCCSNLYNLRSFLREYFYQWIVFHSIALSSEFPKTLPLVHCQYRVQLWTCFVSYDVSSADYKMPDWYIGIRGLNYTEFGIIQAAEVSTCQKNTNV